MKKIFIFSPLFLALAGCGSVFNTAGTDHFACPGMPEGVVCKTPAAVYKSSHGDLEQTDFDTPLEGTQAARDAARLAAADADQSSRRDGRDVAGLDGNRGEYKQMFTSTMPSVSPSIARPIREPAQVMRIWYAPWVDKNDGFNGASYKFVEVVNRKWSFGKPESIMGGVVVPYRDSAPASATGSNPATEVKKVSQSSGLASPMGPLTGVPGALTKPPSTVQQTIQRTTSGSGFTGSPQLPSFDLNTNSLPSGVTSPFN